MTTGDSQLAKTFNRDVYERYACHFVDLLLGALDRSDRPTRWLDLACGTGFATLRAIGQAAPGSSIVSISDDRFSLKEFHHELTAEQRRSLYPRKESSERLPFADSTFDQAWAVLPTRMIDPIKPVVTQTLRVLRPGGLLVLCVPLLGTFRELLDAVAKSEPDSDTNPTIQRLVAQTNHFAEPGTWKKQLLDAGAIDVQQRVSRFPVTLTPPLSSDRLIARHLLPVWLDEPQTTKTDALLNRAITAPTQATVVVGCFMARKGMAD